MNKITMRGTGHGFVHNLYNTCFVINDKFLIVVQSEMSPSKSSNLLELYNDAKTRAFLKYLAFFPKKSMFIFMPIVLWIIMSIYYYLQIFEFDIL